MEKLNHQTLKLQAAQPVDSLCLAAALMSKLHLETVMLDIRCKAYAIVT